MKKNLIKVGVIIGVLYSLLLANSASARTLNVKLIGDTLNFEVQGIQNWNYSLKRVEKNGKTSVLLRVENVKVDELKTLELDPNPFVAAIKPASSTEKGVQEIEFVLKGNDVETFDYLTEDPPRLILDFYRQLSKVERRGPVKKQDAATEDGESVSLTATAGPTGITMQSNSKTAMPEKNTALSNSSESSSTSQSNPSNRGVTNADRAKSENISVVSEARSQGQGASSRSRTQAKREIAQERININNIEYNPLKNSETNIALKSGLFDGGDPTFSRFKVKDFEIDQQQIIKGLNNYYLPFPMLDQKFYFWSAMKERPPKYEVQRADTPEYTSFKLIKNLYDKNRALVLRKTLAWYEGKFPESPYLEMGYLMTADRLLQLSRETNDANQFKSAVDLYEKFLEKWPQSVLAERTSLMIGFLQLEQRDYFQAIRKFEIHLKNKNFDKRKSNDFARLGQAYALSRLGQLNDALQTLAKVENPSRDRNILAEQAFSKADFLMRESRYDDAVKAYDEALSQFSDFRTKYPNALFNQMEALFRTKNPIESHKSALEFVQNFPAHEYAPFALTRLGELLEILVKDSRKSVGAFLETHFRYGDDPKTVIARLHLLSARMKGMKDLELNETLRKMDELTKKSDLENLDQFKVIMVGDGFARRGDFDRAIDILEKFYQQSPNRKNSEQVTNRIVRYAHDMIREASYVDNHRSVLENMRKFRYTWLKNRDRIDTEFAVGRAYQAVGVYDQSLKQVTGVRARLEKLGNTRADLEIRAMQALPPIEKVLLTQSQVEFELGRFKDAYDTLERITAVENLNARDQIDRVYLLSKIYERRGDMETAIRYLTDVNRQWKEEKRHIVKSQLRLAKLEAERKNFDRALEAVREADLEVASPEDRTEVLKTRSEIALKAKNSKVAIESIEQLLADHPDKIEFSEQRYTLGKLYFEQGNIKKAEEVWKQFPGASVWEKLAQDRMADTTWRQDHKKYIQRLPAATESAVNEVSK